MLSKEVAGIPLSRLEAPIHSAISIYQRVTNNRIAFDANIACRLVPTPDKPNSARSESKVFYDGGLPGILYVIAFKPGDGTGSEATHKLEDLEIEAPYPRETKVIPRSKEGIHSEVHLTVLRHGIDDVHAYPELFQGNLDELTIDGKTIRKTYEIGQARDEDIIISVATLTTGYYQNGERFGDPHAIYNSIPNYLQVCAFLAVANGIQSGYLEKLDPQLPREV